MDAAPLDLLLPAALGIGLAAACGLRIFVPLLALSVAAMSGWVELTPGMAWMGSVPALVVFAVATLLEIAAYYVPWVDNALDWLGAPVAVLAGTLVTASVLPDASPLVRWSLAAIAGGGAAGVVHGGLALVRKLSSFTTGGLANHVVATGEAGGSVALSAVAIAAPLLALICVVVGVALVVSAVRSRRAGAMADGRG